MTAAAIVTTTVATAADAKRIAHALVTDRLAACVQILPIESVYRWQGSVEEAAELMLVCKIGADRYLEVEAAILALHGYHTPEIVATPVLAGHRPYLDWVAASTDLAEPAVRSTNP